MQAVCPPRLPLSASCVQCGACVGSIMPRPFTNSHGEVVVNYRRILKATGLAAGMVAAVILAACTTTNLGSNKTGWSDYATITTKDYVPVGIVRVTSEEIKKRGIFGVVSSHRGSQITYDMLISEAKALGADDIINVRIDRVDESVHGTIPAIEWITGYTEKYSYVGTALAIKYKDAYPDFRQVTRADNPGAGGMGGGPG
jgi:hypothetical protein